MKRFSILILIIISVKSTIFAQSYDENLLSTVDTEYSQLYNELLEIVRNEFLMPIPGNELIFVYNERYGYGPHVSPFTGKIYFFNASYLQCNYGTPIFSMTPGIVKNIVFDRMIIIEYNGIEISYRDLNMNDDIKIGDFIDAGQLLGTRKEVDAFHNYFNGIIIRLKYKSFHFDVEYIFNRIRHNNE